MPHCACACLTAQQTEEAPVLFEKINDRWEIAVTCSDGQFQQVSFVNSICTTKGGSHVAYIVDQLTSAIAVVANKKNKGSEIKPFHVKNHMSVFINCLVENPAFDSQVCMRFDVGAIIAQLTPLTRACV
jgi:DNA topoisomerase-2